MELPNQVLVEADLFISYLTDDDLELESSRVVEKAENEEVELLSSSEVYDDVISALRSQEVDLEKVMSFVSDMRAIPHESISATAETARIALRLYKEYGGSRKLHYFDSFHVATARQTSLNLLTSDQYILDHADDLDIQTIDIRGL